MNTKNIQLYRKLVRENNNIFSFDERRKLREIIKNFLAEEMEKYERSNFSDKKIRVCDVILNEIGLGKAAAVSYLTMELAENQHINISYLESQFSVSLKPIITGLQRVKELYEKAHR